MKYRDFIRILRDHGFVEIRHGATSHRRYEGFHSGRKWMVTIGGHGDGNDIGVTILHSMIRQSGLPKKLFK